MVTQQHNQVPELTPQTWVASVPQSSVSSASRNGIEAELLGLVPRYARLTASGLSTRSRLVAWNAALGTIIVLLLPIFAHANIKFAGLCGPVFHIYFMLFVIPLISLNSKVSVLRKGAAVRATVVKEEVVGNKNGAKRNNSMQFTYVYETVDGTILTDTINMPRNRAWQLGFAVGTTFTVLYHRSFPKKPYPYFLINEAEIIGAMGKSISPP